ncbi:MAG TPA: pyrrolo-quinoline quinone [Terriglobales bacterium]|nr:pyrrolo-quinoline quinone [Terriglobales bacterium]
MGVRRNQSWPLALAFIFALLVLSLAPGSGDGKVRVTTYHNNPARQGSNILETILKPDNVNPRQFGKVFSQRVDGYVYAQPLYLPDIRVPHKGVHNVVYVATEHDTVYAFDADRGSRENAAPLWKTSFSNPDAGIKPAPAQDVNEYGCSDIVPEIGITGTPVIDAAAGILYVVSKTEENGQIVQRLHALDVRTGAERRGGPVVISAAVPGTGAASSGGVVRFDPLREHQRAGLLLQDGKVYIAWASHCDGWPYHGWVMAYDARSLRQVAAWNATPNGVGGGIWQSGAAPAGNGTDLFFATGNGVFDANTKGLNYGNSVVRLTPGSGHTTLSVLDYFTPYDQEALNASDIEPGSGGVVLLPRLSALSGRQLMVVTGKSGTIYLLDAAHMGKFNSQGDTGIVQSIPLASAGVWGTPAWWNGTLYVGGTWDTLKAFRFDPQTTSFNVVPESQSSTTFQFPGPTPSISANGNRNGIAWIIQADGYVDGSSEVLRAYDAADLTRELYSSDQNAQRDDPGGAVKFAVPTIANGKVYVGAKGQLSVYGLL